MDFAIEVPKGDLAALELFVDLNESQVNAMIDALATVRDYERRYRLIEAIAALGDRAALEALPATLSALPDGVQAALAQVAAAALTENPRDDALPLALALARHRDPGVRLAALDALAALGASAGTAAAIAGSNAAALDHALDTTLASDTWPEVRRRAAQSLGDRCTRAEPAAALAAALVRDPELDVRGDALAALVQCHADGVGGLLARTWDDAKAAAVYDKACTARDEVGCKWAKRLAPPPPAKPVLRHPAPPAADSDTAQ